MKSIYIALILLLFFPTSSCRESRRDIDSFPVSPARDVEENGGIGSLNVEFSEYFSQQTRGGKFSDLIIRYESETNDKKFKNCAGKIFSSEKLNTRFVAQEAEIKDELIFVEGILLIIGDSKVHVIKSHQSSRLILQRANGSVSAEQGKVSTSITYKPSELSRLLSEFF